MQYVNPELQEGEKTPSFKETATAFWQFLTAPRQLEPVQQKPAQVWPPFLQLFVLKLATALGASILVFSFIRLLGLNPFTNHKLENSLRDTHVAVALLLVAVIGPAIEEFFFRAPLRYSRLRLLVAFLAFCSFVFPSLLDLLGTSTLVNIMLVTGTLMLAIIFLQSDKWAKQMRQIWDRHFSAVFYTFSAAFALIHLANFENLHLPHALIPLLVVPQFIGGLFWGYIRLRFGLGWAIMGHGLFNASLLLLGYLSLQIHQL